MGLRTDNLPPFAVSQLEQVVILTVLLPDLSVSNAAWFKDHVQEFVGYYRPEVLVINLVNVQSVDRLGVGLLISLNTQLRQQLKLCFAWLQPAVAQQLEAMYLRHAFRIVDPSQPCLICGAESCAHTESWYQRLEQFVFVADQPPADIPPLSDLPGYNGAAGFEPVEMPLDELVAAFERDPRYQALEDRRQRRLFWQKVRHYTLIGGASAFFVLGAVVTLLTAMNTNWLNLLDQAKTTMQRPEYKPKPKRILKRHEIVEIFDKNGDGVFDSEDWLYLSPGEKLLLINNGFHERKSRNTRPFEIFSPEE